METKNSIIKSALLSLFHKGKSEAEAYEEISKIHGSHQVTLSVVSKWFKEFESEERALDIKKKQGRKPKFTDEFLINLINENPGLNMRELSKLSNTSTTAISYRLKQIADGGKVVNYSLKTHNRGVTKFSEEFLINLVNENPGLKMTELARLANASVATISRRLKNISINGESLYYRVNINNKGAILFKDEALIKLINENPDVNMVELSKIAGTSVSTISIRLKHINRDEQIVSYCKKGFQNGAKKFTDEYFVNLVKQNPELSMRELAKITDVSYQTISNRLKQINSSRTDSDKIILPKHKSKLLNNSTPITDENLIKLVNDNPNLNMTELAELANTSYETLLKRLRKINSSGEKAKYVKKRMKFTDEYLINLVNENPELSMRELAKIAGTSQSTIFNRINQINSNGQIVNYHKKKLVLGVIISRNSSY